MSFKYPCLKDLSASNRRVLEPKRRCTIKQIIRGPKRRKSETQGFRNMRKAGERPYAYSVGPARTEVRLEVVYISGVNRPTTRRPTFIGPANPSADPETPVTLESDHLELRKGDSRIEPVDRSVLLLPSDRSAATRKAFARGTGDRETVELTPHGPSPGYPVSAMTQRVTQRWNPASSASRTSARQRSSMP